MKKTIGTLLLCLLVMPVCSYAGQMGAMAPAFNLVDMSGKMVSLEQLKGKVVFLVFWAPWCEPCKEELPELDTLYKKYHADGLEVIGISVDTPEKMVARFLQKAPVSFQVLMDPKGRIANAYRLSSLPAGYLLGKDGVIRYQHKGFSKEFLSMYEQEIAELLK